MSIAYITTVLQDRAYYTYFADEDLEFSQIPMADK